MFALIIVFISFNGGQISTNPNVPVSLYRTRAECDAARAKSIENANQYLPKKRPDDMEPIAFCQPAYLGPSAQK
jgi:hypothetical protein